MLAGFWCGWVLVEIGFFVVQDTDDFVGHILGVHRSEIVDFVFRVSGKERLDVANQDMYCQIVALVVVGD